MTKVEMIAKLLNKFNLTEAQATVLVEALEEGGSIDDVDGSIFESVFNFYCANNEMPYGTAKARDGDPYEWIDNALREELELTA